MRVQMKNILCATDFSDFSNHTIPYGVALAKEFDAKLYICHVIDLSSIAIYGEFQLNPVDQQNRIKDMGVVGDAGTYQQIFDKLSKSIFLEEAQS